MPTVADLLSPAPTTQPTASASDSTPAPPPGFVPANDAVPPPPPGFAPEGQAPQKRGSGLVPNFAQGASEGIQFNGTLIRDALINPRAVTDRVLGMVGQVFGDKPAPSAPSLGSLVSIPADIAARKAAEQVVAATPAERIARATGAGATGAVLNPEGTVAQMLGGASAGLGSGVASELVPDNLKPVASLVGGVAGFGLAKQAVAERFGPQAAKVVAEVPRDVALTPEGKLTDDGKEISAQTGLHPDQMKAAYDHFDEVKAGTANDNPLSEGGQTTFYHGSPETNLSELEPHARDQAIDSPKVISLSTDPAFAAGYAGDNGKVYGVSAYPSAVGDFRKPSDLQKVLDYYSAEAAKTGDGSALYPNKLGAEDKAQIEHGSWIYWENPEMWRQFGWDGAFNRELSGRADAGALNVSLAPGVRTAIEDEAAGRAAANGSATVSEFPSRPQASGGGGPPETPSSAAQRLAEAQSEGVDLTKGQATQDFTSQEQEQTLRRMAGTEEGAKAQAFYAQQQQQIADAVERFRTALGNPEASAEERGAQVQDALRTLRDQGKAGVSALYSQAQDAAQALGSEGSNLTSLDTGPLLSKLRELFIDESVPDQVRKALKQQAAKYGLIGQDPTTVEGETTVKLKDQTGQPTGRITFTGPIEPLTIANAEAFRQKVNGLYEADTSKLSQGLKPVLDDAVQQAVERAAREAPGGVGDAFKAARKAHQQQLATFKARDVVQSLVDWKKGAPGTPQVQPDQVLRKILGNDADSVTSLKKVKAVLLNKPTDQTRAAWNAVSAHAVGKLFDKALVLNASADGPVISGAKLNTAIHALGADKLKLLLGEEDFNQLMKLNRIIRNATVPITGTVNHSGTAYTIMNFLGKQGAKLGLVAHFVPVVGPVARAAVEVVAHTAKSAKQSAQAAKTLKGITAYDLTQAANEDAKGAKPDAGQFVRQFIETARDPRIVAPLLAASSNQSTKDKTP